MSHEKDYPFVQRLRTEIYRATGYDVRPDDVLFPLLFCIQIMTRAVSAENRQAEAEEWRKIAKNIRQDLEKTKKDCVLGAVLLAIFFAIGMACGFLFAKM